jgi:hypothetical protein
MSRGVDAFLERLLRDNRITARCAFCDFSAPVHSTRYAHAGQSTSAADRDRKARGRVNGSGSVEVRGDPVEGLRSLR